LLPGTDLSAGEGEAVEYLTNLSAEDMALMVKTSRRSFARDWRKTRDAQDFARICTSCLRLPKRRARYQSK